MTARTSSERKKAGEFFEFSVKGELYIAFPPNPKQKSCFSERRKCGKESETEGGGRVEKRKRTAKKTVSVLYLNRNYKVRIF